MKELIDAIMENPEVSQSLNLPISISVAIGIKLIRKSRGLSKAEVARLVGTSKSSIGRIESGKSSSYTMSLLIKILTVLDGKIEIKSNEKKGKNKRKRR